MLNNIMIKNIIKGTVKLSIVDDKNDQSRQCQLLRVFTSNCILLQHGVTRKKNNCTYLYS